MKKISGYAVAASRVAIVALAAAIGFAPAAAQQQGTVAFVNVNVIPMDRERVLENQTVVVENGRIAAVGPSATTTVPQGATRVDAAGKFLMPGIAEMHGHIPSIQPDGQGRQFAEDVLFLYVAAGATTVRGMQGHASQHEMRRRIDQGELIGPRLYLAAPQLAGRGSNAVTDPEVGRQRVRDAKQAGFDLLKIQEWLSPEVYAAIADEARKQDIPFGGHVPNDVGLRRALSAGQSTIDHLDGYLDATLPEGAQAGTPGQIAEQADPSRFEELARATREAGAAVVPTQSLWETLRGAHDAASLQVRPELRYVPAQLRQNWANAVNQIRGNTNPQQAAREVELRHQLLKTLHDAGVPILMGTDAPQIFSVPGFSLHHELPVMVEAGLTPYQVLESGTIAIARHFGTVGETGTVERGKRADLLLLDANPLQDIDNMARIAGVVVNGRWLSRQALDERLEEIAARYAS